MTNSVGLTQNQLTPELVKERYELNPDTNEFSDAEKLKLSTLNNTTVDSSSVEAAGAVMEADLDASGFMFVIGEDDMISNANDKLPTQRSVKTYVDTMVAIGMDASKICILPSFGDFPLIGMAGMPYVDDEFHELYTWNGATYDRIANKVQSVNNKVGHVEVTKADVGLGQADNTRDINKDVSIPVQLELDDRVRNYRVLSDVPLNAKFTDTVLTDLEIKLKYENNPDTNVFDDAAVDKLAGIAEGAGNPLTPATDTDHTDSPIQAVPLSSFGPDTTLGPVDILLPVSPVVGDRFNLFDYHHKWDINAVTLKVSAGTSSVNGSLDDIVYDRKDTWVDFVYRDAIIGWVALSRPMDKHFGGIRRGTNAESVGGTYPEIYYNSDKLRFEAMNIPGRDKYRGIENINYVFADLLATTIDLTLSEAVVVTPNHPTGFTAVLPDRSVYSSKQLYRTFAGVINLSNFPVTIIRNNASINHEVDDFVVPPMVAASLTYVRDSSLESWIIDSLSPVDSSALVMLIDENDMVSDLDTHAPSQQSVKKFVEDLLTPAQTKIRYELNADTNAFDDAAKNKLASLTPLTTAALTTLGVVFNSTSSTANLDFVIDEDTMSSNLDTKLPTQQSVKAYVDSKILTNAQIKTKYEANTNTNGFTNAEKTKLAGIAAGATAGGGGAPPLVPSTKTVDFVADVNGFYKVDTTSGPIVVTLPSAPTSGDFFFTYDINDSWSETNKLTATGALLNQDGTSKDFTRPNSMVRYTWSYSTIGWVTEISCVDKIWDGIRSGPNADRPIQGSHDLYYNELVEAVTMTGRVDDKVRLIENPINLRFEALGTDKVIDPNVILFIEDMSVATNFRIKPQTLPLMAKRKYGIANNTAAALMKIFPPSSSYRFNSLPLGQGMDVPPGVQVVTEYAYGDAFVPVFTRIDESSKAESASGGGGGTILFTTGVNASRPAKNSGLLYYNETYDRYESLNKQDMWVRSIENVIWISNNVSSAMDVNTAYRMAPDTPSNTTLTLPFNADTKHLVKSRNVVMNLSPYPITVDGTTIDIYQGGNALTNPPAPTLEVPSNHIANIEYINGQAATNTSGWYVTGFHRLGPDLPTPAYEFTAPFTLANGKHPTDRPYLIDGKWIQIVGLEIYEVTATGLSLLQTLPFGTVLFGSNGFANDGSSVTKIVKDYLGDYYVYCFLEYNEYGSGPYTGNVKYQTYKWNGATFDAPVRYQLTVNSNNNILGYNSVKVTTYLDGDQGDRFSYGTNVTRMNSNGKISHIDSESYGGSWGVHVKFTTTPKVIGVGKYLMENSTHDSRIRKKQTSVGFPTYQPKNTPTALNFDVDASFTEGGIDYLVTVEGYSTFTLKVRQLHSGGSVTVIHSAIPLANIHGVTVGNAVAAYLKGFCPKVGVNRKLIVVGTFGTTFFNLDVVAGVATRLDSVAAQLPHASYGAPFLAVADHKKPIGHGYGFVVTIGSRVFMPLLHNYTGMDTPVVSTGMSYFEILE